MEFYESSSPMTDLSVHDVFAEEVQTEMEQILSSEAARFTPDNGDVIELSCHDIHDDQAISPDDVWSTTVTLPGNTLAGITSTNYSLTNSSTSSTTTNTSSNHHHFNTDFSQLTSPDKYGLDSNSLFVDPQTGLPVNTTLQLQSGSGNNNATQQLNLIVSAADSSGQTIQQQIPVSLNLGNINMNLSSQDQGLYTQSALLTVTAADHQQQQYQQRNQQHITFQNAAATLQGLQAAFAQVPLQNQNLQTQRQQQQQQQHTNSKHGKVELEPKTNLIEKVWSKPAYSYSCLITMALKNSKLGYLPVSEIYQFMCENFPYFKTAPDGWKNSVRHNLSLNKCFAKIEKPPSSNSGTRKGCLWALNPEKTTKMEEEVVKWTKKDPAGIRRAMANPDELERIEAAVVNVHHTPHQQLIPNSSSRTTTSHHESTKNSSSSRVRTPPQATAPVTPTTHIIRHTPVVIKSEPKIVISDDFASSTHLSTIAATPDLFGGGVMGGDTMMEMGAVAFEGDFNLQVYADQLGLDPLSCSDFMNLDIPLMHSSGLPSNPVMSSFLDASPIKDASSLGGMHGLDPQQYAQSQFCSPSRTSVSALM